MKERWEGVGLGSCAPSKVPYFEKYITFSMAATLRASRKKENGEASSHGSLC